MLGYIVLGVLMLLISAVLFLIFPAVRRHPDRKLMDGMLIAHRGLHDEEKPENSLSSYEAAAAAGYAIENDLHITADGEVVVFHDNEFTRMCGYDGNPEKMTLAEIKKLRLKGTDEQVPTLQECLDVVAGRVPILIEYKCENKEGAYKLCEAADKILRDYKGKYFVQSFNPYAVRWHKIHRPDLMRGVLSTGYFYKGITLQRFMLGSLLFNFTCRPDFISYCHEYTNNPFRRLSAILGGFPVAWTIRNQTELEKDRKKYKTIIFEDFIPDKK